MAVANYHETYGCFPPAYVADGDGKPMHSWRVLILPYLGQQELYNAYDFAEPWNGPSNGKLAGRIGNIYLRSGLDSDQIHTTSFVAVVGPQTVWLGSRLGGARVVSAIRLSALFPTTTTPRNSGRC